MNITQKTDSDLISISEIFGPTIQGEGALIGTQTIFVRTGGCDYRCSWCDTGYAVLPKHENQWQKMDAHAVFAEIETLSNQQATWITLSGGNPAMQDLEPLIRLGQSKGYQFSMETQGSIAKPWFALLDQLSLSPKPPSTGMSFKKRGLDRCLSACDSPENSSRKNTSLKFVVADKEDLLWAKGIADQYPQLSCFVQPCNTSASLEDDYTHLNNEVMNTDYSGENKEENISESKHNAIPINQQQQMLWLIDEVQQLNWNKAKILPQLHTWLWGDKTGV